MRVRSFFHDLFIGWSWEGAVDLDPGVNPATGLPMLGSAIDVAGNPYGVDPHHHDHGRQRRPSGTTTRAAVTIRCAAGERRV